MCGGGEGGKGAERKEGGNGYAHGKRFRLGNKMSCPSEQGKRKITFLVHFTRKVTIRVEEGSGRALSETLYAAKGRVLDDH